MKTGLFLAALVQLAAAQPSQLRHQRLHEKRAVVTEIDTVFATVVPDVWVYVNQYGKPLTTSTVVKHAHTSSSSSSTTYTSSKPVVVAVETPTPVEAYTAPAVVAAPTTLVTSAIPVAEVSTAAAAAASSTSAATVVGSAITYSPYHADGTCKTQSQVSADFKTISGYSMVRYYGTDCNQVTTIGTAALANGMKLFAGIYDLSDIASEVALIVAFANGDWSSFDTISIGNELVNSGSATVAEVVAAMGTARTLLAAAGYTGKVVTVDTYSAVINNPELCTASDYAAVNAHAFFNADITASQAGSFVAGVVKNVAAACGGMKVVVTESGWPSAGDANGVAVPSEANQAAAIASLKAAFTSGGLILFNAFNDLWKTNNAYTFDAEQYWGIYGTSSQ